MRQRGDGGIGIAIAQTLPQLRRGLYRKQLDGGISASQTGLDGRASGHRNDPVLQRADTGNKRLAGVCDHHMDELHVRTGKAQILFTLGVAYRAGDKIALPPPRQFQRLWPAGAGHRDEINRQLVLEQAQVVTKDPFVLTLFEVIKRYPYRAEAIPQRPPQRLQPGLL